MKMPHNLMNYFMLLIAFQFFNIIINITVSIFVLKPLSRFLNVLSEDRLLEVKLLDQCMSIFKPYVHIVWLLFSW